MEPENVLKGRMAESLIDELLKKSNCCVYRFGYEAVLQNLTQIERQITMEDSDIVNQIRSIPDFLCVKNNKPFFIEVKFRTKWKDYLDKNLKNDFKEIKMFEKINQFWKAKVILITLQKPYIRILYPPYYNRENKLIFLPIEQDIDLKIDHNILLKFNKLVEKYFYNYE